MENDFARKNLGQLLPYQFFTRKKTVLTKIFFRSENQLRSTREFKDAHNAKSISNATKIELIIRVIFAEPWRVMHFGRRPRPHFPPILQVDKCSLFASGNAARARNGRVNRARADIFDDENAERRDQHHDSAQ